MKITRLSAVYVLQACGVALTLGFVIVVAATEEIIPWLQYIGLFGWIIAPYAALYLATRARARPPWRMDGGPQSTTSLAVSFAFLAETIFAMNVVFSPEPHNEAGAFTMILLPFAQFFTFLVVVQILRIFSDTPTNKEKQ